MHRSNYWGSWYLIVSLWLTFSLLFGCCLLISCDNPSFSYKNKNQMEQVLKEAMAENDVPGAMVGVWVPDWGTWIHAEGIADLTTGREIMPADKFRIASITKTFTATVILQLVDEKKLSLEDKLEEWAPEFPYAKEITVRQILNHTAGIYSLTEDEDFDIELFQNPLKKWKLQELLDIALRHEPYFSPGEGWHYSDTGYELLGLIIEEVTGNDVEMEIQQRIVEKLGLVYTSFPYNPEISGKYSHGYVNNNGVLVDYTETDPSAPWAGGAIVSNLYDLEIWSKALAQGQLLSKESQRERLMWVDMPGAERFEGRYGLGICSFGGFIGHNGEILGYNSSMYYLPSKGATIVVMLNKCRPGDKSPTDEVFLHIAKILFPEDVPW